MTENDLFKKLENLKVPQVETPIYKGSLKKALLTAHQNMQSKPFIIPNLFINMKKFAPVSLLAVALVVGVLYGTNLLSSPIASAQSMIEKAIAQVEQSKMAPDQQQKVLAVLNQAKQAKDLKFLGEKETAQNGKVKSLSFTDTNGKAVVVDLKENDLEKPASVEGQEQEGSGDSNTAGNEKTQTRTDSELNKIGDSAETSNTAVTGKAVEVKQSTDSNVEVKAPGADATEAVEASNDPAEAEQLK